MISSFSNFLLIDGQNLCFACSDLKKLEELDKPNVKAGACVCLCFHFVCCVQGWARKSVCVFHFVCGVQGWARKKSWKKLRPLITLYWKLALLFVLLFIVIFAVSSYSHYLFLNTAPLCVAQTLGEDPSREGLLKTPMRAAKALSFFTHGYSTSLPGEHVILTLHWVFWFCFSVVWQDVVLFRCV